jgi:hypothetical protein
LGSEDHCRKQAEDCLGRAYQTTDAAARLVWLNLSQARVRLAHHIDLAGHLIDARAGRYACKIACQFTAPPCGTGAKWRARARA